MCLAVPARVIEFKENDMALADVAGVTREISLALLDDVLLGDYVIVHVGYALNKVDAHEAQETLALLRQALAAGQD